MGKTTNQHLLVRIGAFLNALLPRIQPESMAKVLGFFTQVFLSIKCAIDEKIAVLYDLFLPDVSRLTPRPAGESSPKRCGFPLLRCYALRPRYRSIILFGDHLQLNANTVLLRDPVPLSVLQGAFCSVA